ncbi:MAG: TlpA family protein disulfide reductase [Chloroflexi bacterium]|nr:MAG: TlpA family protein disulfide reductase [Chloroflexota bacterium]
MDKHDEMGMEQGNGRNPIILLGGIALIIVALGIILFGNTLFSGRTDNTSLEQVPPFTEGEAPSNNQPVKTEGPLEVGDLAYDFTLQDLEGNTYTLSELRGRPVIVNFWATWCAPCRVEMPELEATFQKYKDQGLVILALDQDEPPNIVRSFFYDELGLSFTPLLDEKGIVANQYGVFNFPSSYFIDPQGKVTAIHRGPMLQSQIEGYLADTIPQG